MSTKVSDSHGHCGCSCSNHSPQVEEELPYKWTQNQHNVVLTIDMGKQVTRKELEVVLAMNYMKFRFVDSEDYIISGKFVYPIQEDESYWVIEDDHQTVTIELTKRYKKVRWDRVIEGHAHTIFEQSEKVILTAKDFPEEILEFHKNRRARQNRYRLGKCTEEDMIFYNFLKEMQARQEATGVYDFAYDREFKAKNPQFFMEYYLAK